jgi:nicotinamide riboside kinase
LCKPDFPWIEDNLRENPNDREVLFDLFIKILKEYKIDYKILEGSITNRFQLCETNINSYLKNEKS